MKYQQKASAYTLSLDQVKVLIRKTEHPRNRLILKLLAGAGLRNEELATITVPDIDFKGSMVRIVGKGSKVRMVPLSAELVGDLKVWLGRKKKGYVFPSKKIKNAPICTRQVRQVVVNCGIAAGIKHPDPEKETLHPHLLRHTFARIGKDGGLSIEALQAIMGHESFLTTMNSYGTKSLNDLSRETEKVDFI